MRGFQLGCFDVRNEDQIAEEHLDRFSSLALSVLTASAGSRWSQGGMEGGVGKNEVAQHRSGQWIGSVGWLSMVGS